jgi:hypothetical protein
VLRVAFLLDGLPPPLTHSPGLRPTFPLSPPWPEICDHRGTLPADTLDYALAWCASRSGSHHALIDHLERLSERGAVGLGRAALEDLANLYAAGDTAPELVRDGDVRDYVAAIYLDNQQDDAAVSMLATTPIARGDREHECQRAVIRMIARFDQPRAAEVLAFAGTHCLARLPVLRCTVERVVIAPDALRVRDRAATAACPDGSQLSDPQLHVEQVAETYFRWDDARPETWFAVVDAAIAAVDDLPDAGSLAVNVLGYILDQRCLFDAVTAHAKQLRGHDATLDARLDGLAVARCPSRHGT